MGWWSGEDLSGWVLENNEFICIGLFDGRESVILYLPHRPMEDSRDELGSFQVYKKVWFITLIPDGRGLGKGGVYVY